MSEPTPATDLAWVEDSGWTLTRVLLDGGEVTLAELVHADGRVARLIPQEAAARILAQQDPLGRLIGSVVGEVVLGLKNPAGAEARAGAALAFEAAREGVKDAEALRVFRRKG